MRRTPNKKQNGFTIIEVLMSLAILAVLMAAVAVAFDASVKNYQANKGIYDTVNTGRQALLRITNDLRTAEAPALIGSNVGDDPDNSQITYRNDTNDDGIWDQDVTYRFDSDTNTLYYIDNIVDEDVTYTLCENVTSMTFNRATFIDTDDLNTEKVRNVRISITLTNDSGEINQTLAAASVIRRNL